MGSNTDTVVDMGNPGIMVSTEICLISPPSPFLISEKVFPNLGILYLSSVLKQQDNEVQVVDLAGEKALPLIDASIIGITATTPQFPLAIDILRELKQQNSKCWVVIGGPHASAVPDSCVEAGFDQVVVGEGEKAILQIAQGDRRKIIQGTMIEDLDTIPFPDRDSMDIKGYKYFIDGEEASHMMTTRGCPYRCSFCSKFSWDRKVRYRSAENVIQEIDYVQEKYNYRAIMFFDDIFTLNRTRLYQTMHYLRQRDIVWRCFSRSNLLTEELLEGMAKSGCREIGLGVESGSQKVLDTIHKGTTVEQNTQVLLWAKKYGIGIKAFLIIGLPSESYETVKATEQWVANAKDILDDNFGCDFTVLAPYPGADVFEKKEKYDIQFDKYNWGDSWFKGHPGSYKALASTSQLSSNEITELRDKLEKKYKPELWK